MKSITDFALDNSRTVILSMALIVLGGAYLFTKIPKLEDPAIIIREAVVTGQYPGMPVEQVERLITRPIEEELRTMGEVDDIKDSTSKFGQCLIHVTIKDEVPAEELPMVWKLLRNRCWTHGPGHLRRHLSGDNCCLERRFFDGRDA
ncbi:MAG: efflux RND transporter permease subunit [Planctomycetota bacterium]|jgi:multidrug efflux pump subunit AcrB